MAAGRAPPGRSSSKAAVAGRPRRAWLSGAALVVAAAAAAVLGLRYDEETILLAPRVRVPGGPSGREEWLV
jgi:hypothetical protein